MIRIWLSVNQYGICSVPLYTTSRSTVQVTEKLDQTGCFNLRILGSVDQCQKCVLKKRSGWRTSAVDGSEDWQRMTAYAADLWICQPVLQLKFEDPQIEEDDLCMNISTLNTSSERLDPRISNAWRTYRIRYWSVDLSSVFTISQQSQSEYPWTWIGTKSASTNYNKRPK